MPDDEFELLDELMRGVLVVGRSASNIERALERMLDRHPSGDEPDLDAARTPAPDRGSGLRRVP